MNLLGIEHEARTMHNAHVYKIHYKVYILYKHAWRLSQVIYVLSLHASHVLLKQNIKDFRQRGAYMYNHKMAIFLVLNVN